MKIKIWALVLIILGSLVIGSGAMFIGLNGIALTGRLLEDVRQNISLDSNTQSNSNAPNIQTNPWSQNGGNSSNGGNSGNGSNGGSGNQSGSGYGQAVQIPALPAGLPTGFNAGVNIESEYAALTNRTVVQVQAAEQAANTDPWGLAQQEGKINDLKTKVTNDVKTSLAAMVKNGKITQAQSDSYLTWVNQYLQVIVTVYSSGVVPDNGQNDPSATSRIIS